MAKQRQNLGALPNTSQVAQVTGTTVVARQAATFVLIGSLATAYIACLARRGSYCQEVATGLEA